MSDASEGTQVLYQTPAPKVARIALNRPELRNAQGLVMTYELDAAFSRACADDGISVIILAAEGPHFSSGHDLSGTERVNLDEQRRVTNWSQFRAPGHEGFYSREKEIYLEMTERWRNLPKPTIAEVQGKVIAGGNMLVWACDLVIAADDAMFMDNTLDMGIPGAEFFNHPFELGPRKAKEWLFTADWIDAAEAHRLGMVNRVVPRANLMEETLALAVKIAEKPLFSLKLAKEAVNTAQDMMGRKHAMSVSFALHQLAHSHYMQTTGYPIAIDRLAPAVRERLERMRAAAAEKKGGG